jgi:hypothetical protein
VSVFSGEVQPPVFWLGLLINFGEAVLKTVSTAS